MSQAHPEALAETAEGHAAAAEHVPHVLPLKLYLGVAGALLGLTGLTVAVSYFDFGTWNLVVALTVASLKAGLVAAVFMHLAFDRKFNAIVFLLSVVFLVIFVALTMADTERRSEADPVEAQRPRDLTAPFANGKMDVRVAPTGRSAPGAEPKSGEGLLSPGAPKPAGQSPEAGGAKGKDGAGAAPGAAAGEGKE